MPYAPQHHHRRSIRLAGYDYTQPGAYFVTLVTQDRACLFGDVVDGEMRLDDAGHIAEQCWLDIPSHFPNVELDAFVIMPNHVHGILWIVAENIPPAGAETMGVVGAKDFSPQRAKDFSPQRAKDFSPLPSSPSNADQFPRGTSKTIGSVVRGFKIGVTKWF